MALTRRACLQSLAAMAAGAPSLSSAAEQARPSLIVGVQDNPPQLDPLRLTTNVAFRVTASLYDFLIRTDFAPGSSVGARVPGLATSWRALSPTVFECRIRPGVRFHDGSALSAADVAFSFGPERMLTESLPSRAISRQFFGGLAQVEAMDSETVRFVTKEPDPLFEMRLAGWSAQIISKAAFERTNDWDRWAQNPVGTGPYRVAEVRAGELIRLVAHDAYWGGRPPFASITFRVIPEAASRFNALAASDVQIVTEVTPDQIAGIERHAALQVAGGAINNIRVLNYGTFGGPMRDPRIRRAMNFAIDRELITGALLAGRVGVPKGYQWPAYGDMYIEDFAAPRHDPDAARKLLHEAAYSGEPIEYRTQTNYYAAELATAQAIQQMWEAVGLKVDLKVCENWGQVFAQPNYAVFNGSINMVYPDAMGALYVLYGPNGFIRFQANAWKSDAFDRIGATLATPIGRDERRALHRRILELFDSEDPPGTVLHQTPMLYGKRRDIAWVPQPTPFMDFGPFNPATRNL